MSPLRSRGAGEDASRGGMLKRGRMKTYNPALIGRARAMRREMTPAERRLWYDCLRHLPVKFRRQRPIGRFIVDFYAPASKLVIEVDGDSHFEPQGIAYDRERTAYLHGLGLHVLRFTNDEVLNNLEGVHARLCAELQWEP